MQILQGMDADKMVIIFPSALVAMYLVITIQKSICEKFKPYGGLIIPAICFIASTVLAVRPMIIADAGEYDGLLIFCIRMWLTFNISTIVFMVPYLKTRADAKAAAKLEAESASAASEDANYGSTQDHEAAPMHEPAPDTETTPEYEQVSHSEITSNPEAISDSETISDHEVIPSHESSAD